MADLLHITLEDEIVEICREIRMREQVYPRQIAGGNISEHQANRRLAVMHAVLARLVALRDAGG